MDCETCKEHSVLYKDVETLKEKVKDMETKQSDMLGTQIEIKVRLENMNNAITALAADVKALVSAPANNWNKIVTGFITSGFGALIGIMIGKMLK